MGSSRVRRFLTACRLAVRDAIGIVRAYALVFLILLGLLLAVSWQAPRLWLAVAPVVLGLGLILFWGVRRPARGEAASRGVPLQTTLFRAIVVALLAVFGIVMLIQWWDQRQAAELAAERASSRERAVMARGQLDLAYLLQPIRVSSLRDIPNGVLGLDHALAGQGLWVDDTAYWRIRTIIDRFPANGGPWGRGMFGLSQREYWPAWSVLTPAQLRSFNSEDGDVAITGIDSWPTLWRRGLLPPGVPSAEYLKRHGAWIGQGTHPDRGGYRIAVWRTGPDTVYMFASFDDAIATGTGPPHKLLQALYLLLLIAPIAGVTAWYLHGRLVRPVVSVTEATIQLADGGLPGTVPEAGPAELATMARSFNRLAERLDEAEAAQKEFVASVNHELKTPLTSLQGYGELLSDGAVSAEEAGPVVLAETARLERLVGDLLEAGRLESGEFAVREQIVSLDDVAAAVLRRFEATAKGFGISLEVRHEPAGEASVLADEDRLVQVVSNLTENALRSTPTSGSVRVVVRPPAAIRVMDTGPGLAEEDLPHAFDRFYLYERCGKDRPVGTGLGLSIVKELTEAMGGEVRVESESGLGTVFEVGLLPADRLAEGAPPAG